ncbi:uncharacterized protein TRIADDRAFT_24557 [Trichoplax adhaerens]|uniref:Protein LEG1 homolog n=1 Tax=Trichoplax adhaerens TaxID=10228 RepID=B3RUM3_TRIAD|nr:hypothetical protein TRIADDRAFT_24557 [Trichoplax adhaerens]EDV25351.1 hypothetical protein TRIADDRAFT_24557 [Trichoplax adhaerens]|eukprot:XP_002111384.1 hypothetical protein TRIADDRAFT_24557 [Trichoplax adhaerens]
MQPIFTITNRKLLYFALTLPILWIIKANGYPLPPLWDQAPNSLTDYPVIKSHGKSIISINPWNYTQRLGLYKCLLNATDPYMQPIHMHGKSNILWGLAVQLGWQKETGRLNDLTNTTQCGLPGSDMDCIWPLSWWGSINYFLSAIPFLASLKANMIQAKYQVILTQPKLKSNVEKAKFCFSIKDCYHKYNSTMVMWTSFFTHILNIKKQHPNLLRNMNQLTPSEDQILKLMWTAHTQSLHATLELFATKVKYLSHPEQKFALSWANLVYFIGSCHFITDFNNTVSMQVNLLPKRLLRNGDNPPFVKDFNQDINACLFITEALRDANLATDNLILTLWNKAMCTPKGRRDGRFFLTHAITQPKTLISSFLRVLGDILKSPGC